MFPKEELEDRLRINSRGLKRQFSNHNSGDNKKQKNESEREDDASKVLPDEDDNGNDSGVFRKPCRDEGTSRNVADVQEHVQFLNRNPVPFQKLLDGVVFAISGLVNPERANIREKALEMGGQYRTDWTPDCTLLVCAFPNTPKFNQVKHENGTIVSKGWIHECYQKRSMVEIDSYLMYAGKPWRQVSASVIEELDHEMCNERTSKLDESVTTLASLGHVKQWVAEDVSSSIAWLQQQDIKPNSDQLRSIAIEGIEICLHDTVECLKSNQSIKDILETWEFVPRAVRELERREEKMMNWSKSSYKLDILSEAERLKWIYSAELQKFKKTTIPNLTAENKNNEVHGDSDSSETEILGEDEIMNARETIGEIVQKIM